MAVQTDDMMDTAGSFDRAKALSAFKFGDITRIELFLGEDRGDAFGELVRRFAQAIEQAFGLFGLLLARFVFLAE